MSDERVPLDRVTVPSADGVCPGLVGEVALERPVHQAPDGTQVVALGFG